MRKIVASSRPEALSPFPYLLEGSSWEFERMATEHFLSRRCSAIPLQSMGGACWINRIEKRWPQKGQGGKILVRKTLLPFPYMLSGSFVSV
jgi:hypothetical protein